VKNGILSAIEICSNIREQISADFNRLQTAGTQINPSDRGFSEEGLSARIESITELDKTLHEVLDIVLAETVSSLLYLGPSSRPKSRCIVCVC
jgi:hypothetical protein